MHNDTLSCEAILRKMPDGGLIIVCQCGDTAEPAPRNRVYAFLSYDGGETWSDPVSVREEDGCAVYCTEVRIGDGGIIAYLTVHDGHFLDWRCETAVSRDNGRTWSRESSPVDSFAFVRGAVTLSDGSVLMPVQMYHVTEEQNRILKENGRYVWHAFYSFPEGVRTDRVLNNVLIRRRGAEVFEMHPGPELVMTENWVWSEPTVAEVSPGKTVMLLRYCGTGFLWKSTSDDMGRTWSIPEKTDIPSPGNKPKLIALGGGRTALIHTPNPKATPYSVDNRYPLEIWISSDGCKTWERKLGVGAPKGNCSYPDGIYDGGSGHLLFSYELDRKDIYFADCEIPE